MEPSAAHCLPADAIGEDPLAAPRSQEDPLAAPLSQDDQLASPFSAMSKKSWASSQTLEMEALAMASSVTIAKGSRYTDVAKCRVKSSGMMGPEGYSFLINTSVQYAAVHSKMYRAEDHMAKLDARQGFTPDVDSMNALLFGLGQKGNMEKADVWFAKMLEPQLHPELGGMAPNAASYNIMIQAASQLGDLKRAEKYLEAMLKTAFKPHRDSWLKVMRALLRAREVKRSHHWLEAMVRGGCDHVDNYEAGAVKEQRLLLKSMRRWDPYKITNMVIEVIKALADARNTDSAQRWLEYLMECGMDKEDRDKQGMVELWDYVRGATPLTIFPARLYSESDMMPAHGDPLLQVPAVLVGEDFDRPALALPPNVTQVRDDLSLTEQSSMSARPYTCKHGLKPGVLQDSQMRSTWGACSTPRSVQGRILNANQVRKREMQVSAAMVLASPMTARPAYMQRMLQES